MIPSGLLRLLLLSSLASPLVPFLSYATSGIRSLSPVGTVYGQTRDAAGSVAKIWAGSRSDDWNEARRLVHAQEALPLMESLSRRSRDAEGSARAAYWLGLYHYGSGDPATAATYFDLAAAGEDPEVARQARVWMAQCRQLLGTEPSEAQTMPPSGELRDLFDARIAVSEGDALVRAGHPLDAMRSYLALEADARQLGCLSWIYYRVGLILSASSGSGASGLPDWDTLADWDPVVASSPERALIAKLRMERRASQAPRASATPFAEPVVEPDPTISDTPQGPGEFPDSLFEEPATAEKAPERAQGNEASGYYTLQLGAFRERDGARRAMEQLTTRGLSVRLEEKVDARGDQLHVIRLGRCATREEAQAIADRLLAGIEYQIEMVKP